MKCSPGDVPLPLRLELKTVVVLSIAFVRTFSWRWPVVLSSPLGHSGAQYATPGLAFKSPPVGLMYAHFTTFGVHSTIRRSGAQYTRPYLGQRPSVAPIVWAIIHVFSILARCFAHSLVASS